MKLGIRFVREARLIEGSELNVVALEEVHVVEAEAGEALVDAPGDPLGAEVEAVDVATALGGDEELAPRHPQRPQAPPEH